MLIQSSIKSFAKERSAKSHAAYLLQHCDSQQKRRLTFAKGNEISAHSTRYNNLICTLLASVWVYDVLCLNNCRVLCVIKIF